MTLLEWASVLAWVVVAIGCGLGSMLLRQVRRFIERLEVLEQEFDVLQEDLDELIPQLTDGLTAGTEAPSFELPTLDGGRVSLEDFRGRRVLVIFFSPTCHFCNEMAPELAKVSWDGPEGLPVPVVITSGGPEANRKLVEEHGIRCPVLLDEQNTVADRYHPGGTPAGYLIDEEGIIATGRVDGPEQLLVLAHTPAPVHHHGPHEHREAPASDDGHSAVASAVAGGAASAVGSVAAAEPPQALAPAPHQLRVPIRGIPAEGIGVGDLVRRVTDKFGIKPCRGCERRRQAWNRWVIRGSGGGK